MPETFTAYRAGGRSRTVQNIATDAAGVPKPEQIAYTITAATAAPTADTDGYKNLGFLHAAGGAGLPPAEAAARSGRSQRSPT